MVIFQLFGYNEIMEKRVRAIIIEDGKVLLMHRVKAGNEYWAFPGGGVEDSDLTLEDGLKRECKEELGVDVEVKDLVMEEPSLAPKALGQVELFFNCKIVGGKVGTGGGPEFTDRDVEKFGTYKVEWISISDFENKNIYPYELRNKIFYGFNNSLNIDK